MFNIQITVPPYANKRPVHGETRRKKVGLPPATVLVHKVMAAALLKVATVDQGPPTRLELDTILKLLPGGAKRVKTF